MKNFMEWIIWCMLIYKKEIWFMQRKQCDYLKTIQHVYPVNFKVAYAFAAIPSRYLLENKMWNDAAHLEIYPVNFPWEKFSWQKAIIHFTRLIGFVHTGNLDSARAELKKLNILHDSLVSEKDMYKVNQVEIQIKASDAMILFKEKKNDAALDLMKSAADMEDATEKHPVTPGQVVPARELLGDMLSEIGNYPKALEAYQEDLKKNPNRFNALYGAGHTAEKSGDKVKAGFYYRQLIDQTVSNSTRPELVSARLFLKQ